MHLPALIQDLAVILGVAALVTFLFRLIKQPVVLGYIVAGMIVGPYGPDVVSVADLPGVRVWADLGVIFFVFALGLEFSFRRLAKVGTAATVTAGFQVVGLFILGYVAALWCGWPRIEAVFVGCMVCISSTTIILKTLEEAGLKTRRFAELVFGVLIVEDLAAILILVALTNIAVTATVDGLALLIAAGKLALVVGAWLLVGLFVVPRFIQVVAKRGNNEMLIVVALGLCLALVTLSAYFNYSVALGAFIMGSILAETREVRRIEELVAPLKDLFGAIFFVSVGMLLDWTVVIHNLRDVALLSGVVIGGNILLVSGAALLTGQTLAMAVQTAFTLAQIGEFSFIIANLGIVYKVIDNRLYPVVVAVSLLTTFTTPYLVRSAPRAVMFLGRMLPRPLRLLLERYSLWWQRSAANKASGRKRYAKPMRWLANAVLVTAVFKLSAALFYPWLAGLLQMPRLAKTLAWTLTFISCAPFLWAMLSTFRPTLRPGPNWAAEHKIGPLLLSRLLTLLLLGALTAQFIPALISAMVTGVAAAGFFLAFRRQIGRYYMWFEHTFISGIGNGGDHNQAAGHGQALESGAAVRHDHLVPWDAHLARIEVGQSPLLIGQTLGELQLRERYGLSVVVIQRLGSEIIAPAATERVYPYDALLCFATDDELGLLASAMENAQQRTQLSRPPSSFLLRPVRLPRASPIAGKSIREAGIREAYACMVVGIERDGERIQSPKSEMTLKPQDVLWIVGEAGHLTQLHALIAPAHLPA